MIICISGYMNEQLFLEFFSAMCDITTIKVDRDTLNHWY